MLLFAVDTADLEPVCNIAYQQQKVKLCRSA
jgi:hypothetical protein